MKSADYASSQYRCAIRFSIFFSRIFIQTVLQIKTSNLNRFIRSILGRTVFTFHQLYLLIDFKTNHLSICPACHPWRLYQRFSSRLFFDNRFMLI